MKNYILIILALCLFETLIAQNIFVESFNSNQIPLDWTIDQFEDNWSCEQSKKANGNPGELRLNAAPSFTGTSRIISPEIDLTGDTQVFLRFKHFLDQFDTAYCMIGMATRSNGGNWNEVWQISDPIGTVGPANEFVFVNNGDVGQEDFQFCFYFSGGSIEINYWFIDDVVLFNQLETDLELTSLNMPKYGIADNYTVHGRITNLGSTTINSVYINYQLDGGTINTTELNTLDLDFSEGMNFSAEDQAYLESGEQIIDVWISEINYLGNDDNPLNDSLSQTINIATQSVQRLLLFEEFASSTCIPCSSFNNNLLHPLLENNEGKYALIKYPVNYPEPGDPYYFEGVEIRKDFYGVSSAPFLKTDGGFGVMSQNQFNIKYGIPALVEISSEVIVSGNQINITTDILPFVNITNATIYIAVTEKTTSGNVQNNGETEFYNVLMDMLPSADGIPFTGNAGTTIQVNESKDLSGTFIEDFNDLEVVVYLQDNETKQVFQSNIADLTVSIHNPHGANNNLLIYPNPFKDRVNLKVYLNEPSNIKIFIRNIHGQLVKKIINPNLPAGTHKAIWDGTDQKNKQISSGIYFIEYFYTDQVCRKRVLKVH